jgi:hypothetical protein
MVVAFSGQSGAGKSLMAGTLCSRGHSLLSDDRVPVQWFKSKPHAISGYPMIKILPDDASMLGFEKSRHETLHNDKGKSACLLSDCFSSNACVLKFLIFLSTGEERKIEKLSAKEAFINIIPNSAPTMWHITADELHIDQLARLTDNTTICKFTRERNVKSLHEHAEMIEKYCCR